MKRLLLLLAIVAGFMAGCSKSDNGGGSDNIILDESDIKITLDGGRKLVRFTAEDSWSAEVIFDGGSDDEWLTISPTSPNAGKDARSARIEITSNGMRQSIEIKQAGTETPTDGEYEDVSDGDFGDDDDDSDDDSYNGDLSGNMPDNEIWYLSTNGEKAVCNYDGFGVQILSENLRSVRIPESVTKIGKVAFANCLNLKEITIPNSVTSIGDAAFQSCLALTKVKMSENITYIGSSAFSSCEDLKELNIPRRVKYIGTYAFNGCTSLTDIVIPEGVESLGIFALGDCINLVSATIPRSVTTMEAGTFKNCSNLRNVTLTDGLTVIGQSMFDGCTGLESITIPASVTKLGYEAFKGCTGLKDIYCKSTTPPSLGSSSLFENTAETLKIYVPRASVDAYKTDSDWKKYKDSIFGYDF